MRSARRRLPMRLPDEAEAALAVPMYNMSADMEAMADQKRHDEEAEAQEAESQRAEFMRLKRDKFDCNAVLVHPTDADDAKAVEQQMASLKKRELADKLERQTLRHTVDPQIKEAHVAQFEALMADIG